MAIQKMLVCPACKSKNVTWRGIKEMDGAAEAGVERTAKWECADCGNPFTNAQAAPPPPPTWRRP